MKKLFSHFSALGILALFAGMLLSMTMPPATCNENRALGAAHGSALFRECVQSDNHAGWDITYSVESFISDEFGCSYNVTAVACPPCHPNGPCIAAPCVVIAVAHVNPAFDVTSVDCNH